MWQNRPLLLKYEKTIVKLVVKIGSQPNEKEKKKKMLVPQKISQCLLQVVSGENMDPRKEPQPQPQCTFSLLYLSLNPQKSLILTLISSPMAEAE